MNLLNPIENERVRRRLEAASEEVSVAARKFNETQIVAATERSDFFDKLIIGAGAAIAAIVSFLGAHNGHLRPKWALSVSLISLLVTIVAGLYRNFRYPNYVLKVRSRIWLEARLKEQQCKKDFFKRHPSIDIDTGEFIDASQWISETKESDEKTEELIQQLNKEEKGLEHEWHWAEFVCLASVLAAMIALTLLALITF